VKEVFVRFGRPDSRLLLPRPAPRVYLYVVARDQRGVERIRWIGSLPLLYAAFLKLTCIPALAARMISISRLNRSDLI